MTEKVECLVIGAGVVGLAIGRALAQRGREVVVVEAAERIGLGISSRNSEVVHAGIYYPTGSLKARLCVAGRKALAHYCPQHGIRLHHCGKLIVGHGADDARTLSALLHKGRANGVDDLRLLSATQAHALEPALECDVALHSPSTGIIDSHALMLALQGDLEAAGGIVALRTRVSGGDVSGRPLRVRTTGAADTRLACAVVVNAAGLDAAAVAGALQGLDGVPRTWFAKGSYFELQGKAPFSHLVYPAPVAGGLGIHLTIDLSGRARFGPDVEWIDAPEFDVDPARAEGFYAAIRRYWPGLPERSLHSGYAGVRPKLVGPGAPNADFRIDDARTHGIRGLVNLYGIESPGLTSCMAIAEHVAQCIERDGV